MFRHQKIQNLDDFFKNLSDRGTCQDIYYYRINGYTEEIEQFIWKYYETARRRGVVIEGKIPNPDEKNLSYYGEIMGMDFVLSQEFISTSLEKWLPRMKVHQRKNVADSIYNSLSSIGDDVVEAGKDLGASYFTILRKIIFPLSLPGVISGITMVFVPSMTSFDISNILGGSNTLLIGNIIEQEFTYNFNWNLGSGLSFVLLVFTLISMGLMSVLDKSEGGTNIW